MAPNFEAPTDSDRNNSYIVQVRASDGSLSDTQTITINITDVNEFGNDFNADGRSDLLWQSTSSGAVSLWVMDGANFWPTGWLGGSGNPDWHGVSGRGDFNGDGKSDIVWQNTTTGAVSLWFMDGTNFSQTGLLGGNGNPDWHVAGTGDFNGDGKSDLVWQSTGGGVSLWFMEGTNSFQTGLLGGNGNPDWHVIA